MDSADTGYMLTSDDLTAFTHIVGMQGDVAGYTLNYHRPAPPPFTYSLTNAGLADFIRRLHWCSFNYSSISNRRLQQYLGTFYDGLIASPEELSVPALLVAYMWALFCQDDSQWRSFWDGEEGPITWANWSDRCATPESPPNWSQAVRKQLRAALSSSGAPTIWFPSGQKDASDHRVDIIAKEMGLFDPKTWTNVDLVAQRTIKLWLSQSDDLSRLTGTQLDDQTSLYLLHLLTGLCTFPVILEAFVPSPTTDLDQSRVSTLARVNAIARHGACSPEYPNDTFIGQLVYFALMELADPEGRYQWGHHQLASTLGTLAAAAPNQDRGSVVLRKTFAQQATVLHCTASYPFDDPYNPGISYPQRKADTLAALNRAWADLKPEPSQAPGV
jgi:hypothetical protein